MPTTVIRIQENLDGTQEVFWLDENKPKAGQWQTLVAQPDIQPFLNVRNGTLTPDQVQAAGDVLFKELKAHPAVALKLAAVAHSGAPHPIYLYLQATRAEGLPWEALFDAESNGFCAFNHRPIGRIVESRRETTDIQRTLSLPIRIVAVISAIGVDPTDEWSGLRDAIAAAPFPIEATVFLSSTALFNQITAENQPNVRAQFIVDRSQLLGDITAIAPQVLHFFCHGSSDYGPSLEIGNRADEDSFQPASISLESADFDPPDLRKSLWLVTLNACESAAVPADAADDEVSLARGFVDVGVPVVVAMRERVAFGVANLVTRHFYSKFLCELDRVLQLPMPADGAPLRTAIEWATILSTARRELVAVNANGVPLSQAAKVSKEWTLPALYVRACPALELVRESGPPTEELQAHRAEYDTLQRYRSEPPLGTPASVLAQIDDRLAELKDLLSGKG